MSILKNNLRLSGSPVQSDARSTNSRVSNLVCATILAGLILFGGGAKAANMLINPGAETGDFTGWTVGLTGYEYVVGTNGNRLSRSVNSGQYMFQLFDTTASSAIIYQDFAANPGSQWSGSCYAVSYATDYFQIPANAHMQVVFYNTNNVVVPSPSALNVGGGVYGSEFLDPNPPDPVNIYWVQAPPTNVWVLLLATNIYDTDPATEASFDTTVPTNTLTAPPGTAFVRYQLEFDNTGSSGGAVYWDDCDLEKITGSDPDITTAPTAVTTFAGLGASFTVVATVTKFVGEKITFQWQKNGTNLPAAGGVNDIVGDTVSATLQFDNLQGADGGLFDVVVTGKSASHNYTNSIRSVPVRLSVLVLTCIQKANAIGPNFGFENAPVWAPWEIFNGCYFASTNNVYGATTNQVNVLDGNWVALVGANGDRDNGFHHTFAAAPGTFWKAGGWAYISSLNDFIGGNSERIQIWFKDASGTAVPGTPTYESFKIYGTAYTNADTKYNPADGNTNTGLLHAQLPRDQWVHLAVTNVVNNGGVGLEDDIPYAYLPGGIFMVPTNTTPPVAQINFQVYELCPIATDVPPNGNAPNYAGVGADAVYWDDMELFQIVPVTNLTASVSGNNINLNFSASAGLDYSVLYKTNLLDPTWNVLVNNITDLCTNATVTVSDPMTSHTRFYRVQVQ
jgi:hypothetical protein